MSSKRFLGKTTSIPIFILICHRFTSHGTDVNFHISENLFFNCQCILYSADKLEEEKWIWLGCENGQQQEWDKFHSTSHKPSQGLLQNVVLLSSASLTIPYFKPSVQRKGCTYAFLYLAAIDSTLELGHIYFPMEKMHVREGCNFTVLIKRCMV